MKLELDLRIRCKWCGKIPRGKMQAANYERYKPFCTYGCQHWFQLEEARVAYCVGYLAARNLPAKGKR